MKTLFFLLLTLFFATIGFAEVSHQSDESNKKIEKIEEKLDTTKEELTKYTQITDDTKERVGDISSSVDRLGILVTIFGILMTVIVIFFSIRSTREAKLEAKEEAQKLLKEWIDKEAKSVFEKKVNDLSDELQAKGDEILKRIEDKANEQHQRHEEDHQRLMNPNSTQEEKDEVAKEAKQIEGKREEDLTFNDYWIRIVDKYHSKAYDDVIILIDKAMELSSAGEEQMAQLLMAKAETLGQQEKSAEEIKVYDELISSYKDSKIEEVIEYVAKAVFSKGFVLGQQSKPEEAIKTYAELISTYKDSKIERIIKLVLSAIKNKLAFEIILDKPIPDDRTLIDKLTQLPKDIASIDMLLILQNAKTFSQDTELESWLKKYKDIKYPSWNFYELEKWIANANYTDDVKQRIRDYIETFKTHLHRA